MGVLEKETARRTVTELETLCGVRPTADLLGELAACYYTLGDSEKALPLAEAAWNHTRHALIGMNLALIYKDLGRHDDATRTVERAYCLEPENAYIRLGFAEGLLKAGLWKQAWLYYDNSRPTQLGAALDLRLPQTVREWNGEPLPEGHQLLVINEGGTGDRLSYPRWLSELTRKGINWVFYPYSELYSFFERIWPREKLIKDGDDINPTHWCTAFSLPAKLNVGPNEVPPPLPILAIPEQVQKYIIPRTANLPIVGICYDASEKFQGGRKVRSLTEGQAMRLVTMTGNVVQWVNLQFGQKMPYPVNNVPFVNWEETAGLVSNLDAVVSVDTSVMHLAGALRKPLAVLLSANSCWKFLRDGEKCVWYPTARLFRNKGYGFENAITNLISAIRKNPLDFCSIVPA
jgi:tetratricopeptide (TPR) repeat protein